MLEVTGVRQDSQLTHIAERLRGGAVGLGDEHRDGLVLVAVENELLDSERQALTRGGEHIALGMLLGGSTHQRERGLVRRRDDSGQAEIGDPRLGDDGTKRDPWRGAWRLVRERPSGGGPERKLPACAVPDRANSIEIERYFEIGQQIDSRGDVGEGLRPATAVPYTPVFEVPGSETPPSEVLAEPRHQRAVPASPPVAAVDDHDDCVRPAAVGQEQLAELARVIPVTVQRAVDCASVAPSEHADG